MNSNDILNLSESGEKPTNSETTLFNLHSPGTQVLPLVYVICDESDLESVKKAEERVLDAGCRLLSSRDYLKKNTGTDAVEIHNEYLTQCDAVLIYWNRAPIVWVRKKVSDLQAIMPRREGRGFRAQVIFCDGDLDAKKALLKLAPELSKIEDYAELSDSLSRLSCQEIKPYPGLRPFEYKENYLFFGREGKAQEIATRLQNSHFVAVVGTSGSGKSSVVRAGLLPLLYGGMLYESGSNWRIAIMRPEETPIRNLAEALVYPVDLDAEENGNKPKDETQIGITEAVLRRSGVGLLDFVNNPVNNFSEDENLLVVVDQFEELFRFKGKFSTEYSEEAAAFVKLLLEGTRGDQKRIYVVITMRSDFLGDCAQFHDLPEAINEGQYLIPQMTREQLRQSIESPAMVGDSEVSLALVNRILNDLEDDQDQSTDLRDRLIRDQLPVLQHALMRTWDLWKEKGELDKLIDVEHYEEIGGINHALSKHADEAYDELSESQKTIAEKMFKCLTETDSENREIRRPAKVEEICSIIGVGAKEVFEVIEVFRKEGRTFLMPPFNVPLSEDSKIDISHESLIRNWELLKKWVKRESKDAQQYRRIAEAALFYNESGNESFLWRGQALNEAVKWRNTFNPSPTWTGRYQKFTEEEKQGLTQIKNSSLADEETKRRELIQKYYDSAMTFLAASEKKEAEVQARERQIQQERIEFERERAKAAQQLAEAKEHEAKLAQEVALAEQLRADAEHDKAVGLEKLTDSLKRQKKVLIAVSAFSILLMLATSVLAIVAWQSQAMAKSEQENAEKQKDRAELSEKEAINQRRIALEEKGNAEEQEKIAKEQKQKAEDSLIEAEKQEQIAEGEKKKAEEQKQIALKNEKEALNQKQKAQDLTKRVEAQAKTELEAVTKRNEVLEQLESERRLNQYTSGGLFALENYDYADALTNFDLLKSENTSAFNQNKIDEEAKIKNEWWANYNLAKSYQQQTPLEFVNLDDKYKQKTKFQYINQYFDDALGVLGVEIIFNTGSRNPFQNPINYFQPISYSSPQSSGTDHEADYEDYKIITLRKYGQFYRNCATNPETCFNSSDDNYGLNNSGATANTTNTNKSDTDPVSLNKKALEKYDILFSMPKIAEAKDNKYEVYKAIAQVERADINYDLYQYFENNIKYLNAKTDTPCENDSKTNTPCEDDKTITKYLKNKEDNLAYLNAAATDYENSSKIYEAKLDKSLYSISLRKIRLKVALRQRNLPSIKSLTDEIIAINGEILKKSNVNDLDILYDKNTGAIYEDLANIYTSYLSELWDSYDKKIKQLKDEVIKKNQPQQGEKGADEKRTEEQGKGEQNNEEESKYKEIVEKLRSINVNAPEPPNTLTKEEREIWDDLSQDSKMYNQTNIEQSRLEAIVLSIAIFQNNKVTSSKTSRAFDYMHQPLVKAYSANNECSKAAKIMSMAIKESEELDSTDEKKYVGERLSVLSSFARYYRDLRNYKEADKYYQKLKTLFMDKKSLIHQQPYSEGKVYFEHIQSAGKFFYEQKKYEDAGLMFKGQLEYLNYRGSQDEKEKSLWGENDISQLLPDERILVGMTYVGESEIAKSNGLSDKAKMLLDKAITDYSILLKEIGEVKVKTQKQQKENEAKEKEAKEKEAKEDEAKEKANKNITNTSQSTTSFFDDEGDDDPFANTSESIIISATKYEIILQVYLAELYIKQNDNRSEQLIKDLLNDKNLQNDETLQNEAMFQDKRDNILNPSVFINMLTASSLKNIGDYILQSKNNKTQSAYFYDLAAYAFSLLEGQYKQDGLDKYFDGFSLSPQYYEELLGYLMTLEQTQGKTEELAERIKFVNDNIEKAKQDPLSLLNRKKETACDN